MQCLHEVEGGVGRGVVDGVLLGDGPGLSCVGVVGLGVGAQVVVL